MKNSKDDTFSSRWKAAADAKAARLQAHRIAKDAAEPACPNESKSERK